MRSVDVQSEPRIDLPRVSERELIGIGRGERRRGDLVRHLRRTTWLGRQRLTNLKETAIRVLDSGEGGQLMVVENHAIVGLHRRGREKNSGVGVRKIVIAAVTAANDLLRVGIDVV